MSEELSGLLEGTREKLSEKLREVNQLLFQEFQQLGQWEAPTPEPPPPSFDATDLMHAANSFSQGSSQIEILKSLVHETAKLVPRAFLLIRKSSKLHGWAGEGFGMEFLSTGLKRVVWGIDAYPELVKVTQARTGLSSNFSDLSDISDEISRFDGFTPFKSSFFPLVVKGKVAAVLYIDSGSEAQMPNGAAAELLCHVAGLELTSLAFMGKKSRPAQEAPPEAAPAPAPTPAPAAPAPAQGRGTPRILSPVEPEPVPDFHPDTAVKAGSVGNLEASGATLDDFKPTPVPGFTPPGGGGDEDPGIKKAKRVARVLVSDLKLYNEQAVAAAQNSNDLYNRIKEDVDRSYQHYRERTNGLVPDGTNYFKMEMVRQLGNGNAAVLGSLPF